MQCYVVYTDQEYIVPVFVNGLETWGWRDSGCDVPLLISKDLIKAEDIDYENCLTLKGAFDKNNTHSIPTATVKVRSPRFLYDKDVEAKAGVLILPKGVNCLIGNALFKKMQS